MTHVSMLYLLVEYLSVDASYASGIGFVVATIQNYLLQHYFVFGVEGGQHHVLFTRYLTVTTFTFGVNLGLFWCLHELLAIWYLMSQVMTTGLIFILNFFANRSYTFRAEATNGVDA